MQPTMSLVYVTPEMAEAWLKRNVKNRNFKKSKIAAFTRDMAAGAWQVTGEAIKFAANGALLDGQNRLAAVVRSGETIAMFVVHGLEPESQTVMDTGTPRSIGDALRLEDYHDGKTLAATVNIFEGWRQRIYANAMSSARSRLTNTEALEVVRERPGLVDSAAFGRRLYHYLALPTGALATAHYLFTQIDVDDAEEYFSKIIDLRTNGTGDPINTLIKRVGEMRDRRERVWPSTALYMLFRSWNAMRAGESTTKFAFGSPSGGWAQIPEPK